MLQASLRRGLAAGLLAGILAGLFGLAAGEPSLDAAIALEQAADADDHGLGETLTRPAQKVGLVAGSAAVGAVAGLLFGLAAAWAVGRVGGDGWSRSLKLGAVAVGVFVVLPALVVPANPPGVGDPDTVGTRTTAYLLSLLIGLLTAAGLRTWVARRRGQGWPRAVRWALAGALAALVVAALVATRPDLPRPPPELTGGLLWRFRLAAVTTQGILLGGTALLFGLFVRRAERAAATAPAAAQAAGP
ncbi:MAG TPA: CbtA family protein [Egibacteraceae bacterium]|nr:CbtA family protein [Egibacteraceae bacterium]